MKKTMLVKTIGTVLLSAGVWAGAYDLPEATPLPLNTVMAARSLNAADSQGFVNLAEAVPEVILEVRYYSTYNFVGDRIDGYKEPCLLLTREAAAALKEVAADLMGQGYRLKIYDAYRPQMAVDNFVRWAKDLDDTRMKAHFYPAEPKDTLFDKGYIALHSGHSRGSTLDLTLFDMKTEKEVDMGGTFDHFGVESHPDWCGNPDTGEYTGDYPGSAEPKDGQINETQFKNRQILREAMLRHGFKPLDTEWWHFTLKDEPYPDTYFTFPSQRLN
ncbi:MAG: M15 family metallopeptidase [Selenomonadaceae bacterium]|nr:M15 family metallopeptidase [Selenomonadaceae bacterium]